MTAFSLLLKLFFVRLHKVVCWPVFLWLLATFLVLFGLFLALLTSWMQHFELFESFVFFVLFWWNLFPCHLLYPQLCCGFAISSVFVSLIRLLWSLPSVFLRSVSSVSTLIQLRWTSYNGRLCFNACLYDAWWQNHTVPIGAVLKVTGRQIPSGSHARFHGELTGSFFVTLFSPMTKKTFSYYIHSSIILQFLHFHNQHLLFTENIQVLFTRRTRFSLVNNLMPRLTCRQVWPPFHNCWISVHTFSSVRLATTLLDHRQSIC